MGQLADQLRELIKASGKSANEIAEEAKVSQPLISRFLNGSDMLLENYEKVMTIFDLRVVHRPKKRKGKGNA